MPNRHEPPPVLLIGGGGHAAVIHESICLSGRLLLGFVDDAPTGCGLAGRAPCLGAIEDLHRLGERFSCILAVGQLQLRRHIINTYAVRYASVRHPAAIVSRQARVQSGSFVAAGAIIGVNATVGQHAIINTRAVIEHDCTIASNAHIAPGAVLGGGVRVGADTLIGLNASVKPHLSIGRGCVVGAGAVVVRDVEDGAVVAGVPARSVHRSTPRRRMAQNESFTHKLAQ